MNIHISSGTVVVLSETGTATTKTLA